MPGPQGERGTSEGAGGGGLIWWINGPQISGRDVEATFRVMLPRSYNAEGIVVSIDDGYGAQELFGGSDVAARYSNVERYNSTRDGQLYEVSLSPRQQVWDYTYMCVNYIWSAVAEDVFFVAGCSTIGGQ